MNWARVGRGLTSLGTGVACAGTLTAAYNLATMRVLPRAGVAVLEPVTVCIPARDEAETLPRLIADLRAQVGVPRMRVLILNDASTDDTFARAHEAIDGDERFTLLHSAAEPAPGWTGKAAACARLAARAVDLAQRNSNADIAEDGADSVQERGAATQGRAGLSPRIASRGETLVFLDADVRVAPQAIASAVAELRRGSAGLVSVWPEQLAGSTVEKVMQPLLAWSWASTLPVTVSNRSLRTSMAVACGQFLVIDADAYRAAGGHAAVAASATEDLDLARALRRSGAKTVLVAAGPGARTRMYTDATALTSGYTRWLHSAYGGRIDSGAAVGAVLALAYWVPPVAAVFARGRTRRIGLLGYAAAVTGRLLARRIETPSAPPLSDVTSAAAHPLAVANYLTLWARSHYRRRNDKLRWKGRTLVATGHVAPASRLR
ncbi:glycosyltransferase [Nocardia camponoti]|uniref:4,4'-diaponeurosporenoate glycosyltransferase n=1 Tax=Nocardia camponoti TaxID=1616106 RepID=A0A917VDV0_9NOCA|nr:glycosyltransferase [Nocardia camponoti]GGK66159.1 glycosyl transferase [Nocardia camponoti]